MTRLRHDLDFLVSVGLLSTGIVTAATGLISDVWDLNDFWYHTVSGYVMGVFAIAHVILNWGRLTAYGRYRVFSFVGVRPANGTLVAPGPVAVARRVALPGSRYSMLTSIRCQ